MIELTKREDQIMQIMWRLKTAVIREIVAEIPPPQPHYNTVATLVKILVKKGVLTSDLIGNTHQYRPVQDFAEYREKQIGGIKEKFFDNSLPKLIAHYAKKEKLTEAQKAELIKIINEQS